MSRLPAWLAVVASLCACPGVVAAQASHADPPIDTDRPDVTDGAHTLIDRHLQFESGYTSQQFRQGSDAASSITVPELLVRWAVLARAELRLGETYRAVAEPAGEPDQAGWDDFTIGTKLSLADQRGARPAIGVEMFTSVPSGNSAAAATHFLPGGALLTEWEGEGPWSAGAELQAVRDRGAGSDVTASVSVQREFGNHSQAFAETYTVRPVGSGQPAENYLNAGLLHRLTPDVQVDGRVGLGLNHAASELYVGFGLAVRM